MCVIHLPGAFPDVEVQGSCPGRTQPSDVLLQRLVKMLVRVLKHIYKNIRSDIEMLIIGA